MFFRSVIFHAEFLLTAAPVGVSGASELDNRYVNPGRYVVWQAPCYSASIFLEEKYASSLNGSHPTLTLPNAQRLPPC